MNELYEELIKNKYIKIIYAFIWITLICYSTVCYLSSCRTTRIDNIRTSSEYQKISGQLEVISSDLAIGLESSTTRIDNGIKTSQSIADEVERLDYYIRLYDREVMRLRDEINKARNEIKQLQENINNNVSNPGTDYINQSNNINPKD